MSINARTLKIIAVITMFIDHLTYAFLEVPDLHGVQPMNALSYGPTLDGIGRLIGRTAMPIYAFLLVEGYVYTRNRWRYLGRLVLVAVLSELPFQYLFFPRDKIWHCDTLFTLALGLIAVWVTDTVLLQYIGWSSRQVSDVCAGERDGAPTVNGKTVLRAIVAAAAVACCCLVATRMHADYRYGGVLLVLIYYLFRRWRLMGCAIGYAWISWYNTNELYSLPAMALIQCYNGQRGRQCKWFFYLFYPGHLVLLLLLRRLILGY